MKTPAPAITAAAIRAMRPDDWPAVCGIYADGIAAGDATFEAQPPTWEDWDASHLAGHRLVAIVDEAVAGWAALSPVSRRCAYAGVAEDSVYVAAEVQGRGVGRALLRALIDSADAAGIWTIEAGVFPENAASVALHLGCGFRVVGTRERLGAQAGRWRDVLLLERRAP